MISFFPIFLYVRYFTSNILWLIGLSIFSIIVYAIIFLKKEFFDKIMEWIQKKINEYFSFIQTIHDLTEKFVSSVRNIMEKVGCAVLNAFSFLGNLAEHFDKLSKNRKKKDEFYQKQNQYEREEDEDKNEKEEEEEYDDKKYENEEEEEEEYDDEKEKEEEEEEKIENNDNKKEDYEYENNNNNEMYANKYDEKNNDLLKKTKISEIITKIIDENKIKICLAIVVYTFFQNLLIAYISAFVYSILLFVVYALYQLSIEKITKSKLNYYSVMWNFYFLNKQIIVMRIWLKFFGYQSFMYGNYQFKGFSVLQLIYIIIEFIRIIINSIEIVIYISKGITKKITSNEIISSLIFPF